MPRTVWELQQRRHLLADRIAANLDILIGSITTKGPKRPGYNLTFKVAGVTRSRHIRKEDLPRVRQQCAAYRTFQQNLKRWRQLTVSLESLWKQLQQAQSP